MNDYPRPSLAVDTALLTVQGGALCVLLIRVDGSLRLPGTFVRERERLGEAVQRSLRDKAGVIGLRPRQLHVFDDPSRDDRGWVVSVAHLETVPVEQLASARGELVEVRDLPALPWDHAEVVRHAVDSLRTLAAARPDPARLLGDQPITLAQLHRLHEAITGHELPRDAFRRRMEPMLVDTGIRTTGGVGKPARLFTHPIGVELP